MSNRNIGGPLDERHRHVNLPSRPMGGNNHGAGIRVIGPEVVGEMIAPGPLWPYPIYPGQGYPANPGEARPGLSPFGRLAKGQPLGKSTLLRYNASQDGFTPSMVDILRVEGDDLDATQMVVTLVTPRVIVLPFGDATIGDQNITGEQDNAEVDDTDFPETSDPIRWPPVEAIIEWGVRGASARAIVDFCNGCTILIPNASFCSVKACISQSSEETVQGTSANYWLSAFIGPGYNRTGTAKRTIFVGEVASNAEGATFDVPKFARKVTLVGLDESATPNVTVGFVRFWQSPDGTNNAGNFIVSGNQPGPFDVPNGAQYFSVFNQGTTMKFAAIFELAL